MRAVDGACSGVTEEISRSDGDTVRARIMQPMTDSHGCDGRTGATWCSRRWGERGGSEDARVSGAGKKGNGDGGECGKGSREMVKRGEDERHLPRREYVGRQTDDRDGVMFCFTRDREQTAGVPMVSRPSFGLPG